MQTPNASEEITIHFTYDRSVASIRKSRIPRPKILVQQKLYRIWSATGNQESSSSTTHTSLIHHQSRESMCKPQETSPRSRNSPEKLETATAVLHLHKWPHRGLKSGSKSTCKSSIEAPESAFHCEIGRSASWWPKNARESAYEGEREEERRSEARLLVVWKLSGTMYAGSLQCIRMFLIKYMYFHPVLWQFVVDEEIGLWMDRHASWMETTKAPLKWNQIKIKSPGSQKGLWD